MLFRRCLAGAATCVVKVCCAWTALQAESGSTPAVFGTRDFVVVGVSPERAEAITSVAVEVRRDIVKLLFGSEKVTLWAPPCEIHVHQNRQVFAESVDGAPDSALGATSIEFQGNSVWLRRIDVVHEDGVVVPSALAHELVHVVLADHFTEGPPPPWVDEGLATLFDDLDKQLKHESDFRDAASRGSAYRFDELMRMERIPEQTYRQRVFYGQSAAIVRWLLTRADGPTLLRFINDSTTVGLSRSLRMHYAIDTSAALETAWHAEPIVPSARRVPAAVPPTDIGVTESRVISP